MRCATGVAVSGVRGGRGARRRTAVAPTGDTGAAEDGRRRLAGHLQNLAVPDRWSRVLSTTYSCDVPKTLAGEELDLDDGPARDAALFLVDGNNLVGGPDEERLRSAEIAVRRLLPARIDLKFFRDGGQESADDRIVAAIGRPHPGRADRIVVVTDDRELRRRAEALGASTDRKSTRLNSSH